MKKKILYYVGGIALTTGIILSIHSCAAEPEEVQTVSYEQIPIVEQTAEIEEQTGEVFSRTHEILCNEFTTEEAQLLMKVAEAEAGNQGEDGMWLVMSVIFNRREDPTFPDSIKDVVYQPHQFSTVSNGSINRVSISPEAHEALARIECGDVAPQIIAFETTSNTTLDRYFCCAFAYRDHQFYTSKH